MNTSDSHYIYADNAATTRPSQRAIDAMMPFLTTDFGNPSGIHRMAKRAAEQLDTLHSSCAELLDAPSPRSVVFTSGGSESDNWALVGAVERFRRHYGTHTPVRIITTPIEHDAILNRCRTLKTQDAVSVHMLPVDQQGFVHADDLASTLDSFTEQNLSNGIETPPAALVSIMLANNEIGTIQDIEALAAIAHDHGVPFHTDAVQAVGHIPVSFQKLGVDALSLSGHKFHGPRGIGALVLSSEFDIRPYIDGGGQEWGLRSGTQNIAAIAGMEAALRESIDALAVTSQRVAERRDRLVDALLKNIPDITLSGASLGTRRLPSLASFAIKDVDAELLCVLLDKVGIAASTGSACSAGSTEPSHVIEAIGIHDPEWSHGTLRLSLADDVSDNDINELIERIPPAVRETRLMSGPISLF